MLKVLYLRSSFDLGGTESLLLNLYNYPQNKIQFHYAFLKDGSLISALQSEKNKYYKLFRKRKIDFKVIKKLSGIIKYENIQVIHTHQMFELFYGIILKVLHPYLKIFHTIHGYFEEKNKWAPLLEKFLIRFTIKTFTVSYATRNILQQKGYPIKKIKILYNAVNFPPKANESEIQNFKKRINYNPGDFLAGMIGSFVWQKDQCTIVKAYNLIKDKIPALKIVFIGKEGDLSNKCKELLDKKDINKHVFFLGPLENAGKYLPIFDLFIMSTLMDTFGIVVIEALMQKIPVLASDIETMKELSHNGKYFELFKTGNSKDLARKIVPFFNKKNSTINKSNIHKSYKYVLTEFNIEKYFTQINHIYKNLFQENHL